MTAEVLSPATDAVAFARQVLGVDPWAHQEQLMRSLARFRAALAGRQAGKSEAAAMEALFVAATRRDALVLIVSAGEVASRRLLERCAQLTAAAPMLAGSVLDESRSELRFSNGSRVLSVPASIKQIRGWAVDLLIVDESAFLDGEIWRAAEPAIVARPGSRVLLFSSPWGSPEHWFRRLWQRGIDHPDDMVESFHWPSSISPLVDEKLIEHWRNTWLPLQFQTECLGEFADDAGSYLTEQEISACVANYELLPPERALERGNRWQDGPGWLRCLPAAGGVDFGFARDANTVVLLPPLEDFGLNEELLGPGRRPVFVPWLEARHRWPWSDFIDRVADITAAYKLDVIASETNGVGAYPTDDLAERVFRLVGGRTAVHKVFTDLRRKQSGFGKIKSLLQHRQLVLPNHPELLKQLRSLEFSQLQGGGVRIAVPESRGHDDLAMALMQAVSCVQPARLTSYGGDAAAARARLERGQLEVVTTPAGIVVPARPRPDADVRWFAYLPEGMERGGEAGW